MSVDRLALAYSISYRVKRLAAVGGDAVEVLDGFLSRLELGAERYGALVLATTNRNWEQEADEEIADYAVYRRLQRISARRQQTERHAFDVTDLDEPVGGGQ